MKKKNVLTMALSVSLVGVIAVGGTLAYLSDKTDNVTNTFTFDDAISIDLKEHPQTAWNGSSWNDTLWDNMVDHNEYVDVLPNAVIHKDPMVKFNTVPKTGANLYVSVTGLNDNLVANIDTSISDGGWKKIADIDGSEADSSQNGIYAYMASDTALAEIDETGAVVPVFTTVTVGDVTEKLAEADVVLYAYSVQATGDLGKDEFGEDLNRNDLAIDALQKANASSNAG